MAVPNPVLRRISQSALDNSPVLEKVGLWMAAHPLRVIALSAEEVAQQSGVSLAAVNRFARSTGFEGFAHLKAELAEELQDAAEPIRKLMPHSGMPSNGARIAGGSFDIAQRNLQVAAQALDSKSLEHAARRILKARVLYTLGLGMSSYLAHTAAHLLMPYAPVVTHLAGDGGTEAAARRMTRIGDEDVLLAVSLPRYSRDTASLARYARERGAWVLSITDRPGAPLAAHADAVLLAPADHGVLSSSAVAALAVIEALTTRVMQLNPDSVRLATELSEAVLDHLSVGRSAKPSA